MNKFKFAVLIAALLVTACKEKPISKYNPSVQNIIAAQNRDIKDVGVSEKPVSKGIFEIETTAPQGTVPAAAQDMFQKRAFELCKGDNYTYAIKSQENVSYTEFVGMQQKVMTAPTVRGTIYCNTRGTPEGAALQSTAPIL